MELNGKYKSLQFGNRNSLSSDHIEPRIDSSSTLKEVKDSPLSHVPRLDENVPKTPSKKIRRSKNLNPLMAKPKASMSKLKKLMSSHQVCSLTRQTMTQKVMMKMGRWLMRCHWSSLPIMMKIQ